MTAMIRSVRDKRVQQILDGRRPKRFLPGLLRAAEKRITALEVAEDISDLTVPPSMRLEKLGGDREGTWSIRVNRQWRICFRWETGGAYDVEFVDYH